MDDLVKKLRDLGDHASFEPHMHHMAADRIEELEAQAREDALQYLSDTGQMSDTIDALTRKLKIARNALISISNAPNGGVNINGEPFIFLANAALAQMEDDDA